ncbi:hypothetical protein EVAR_30806_1 [Eumeta japonica]|uniref:Uncharacterized protein n=1 Tax=Eumeta variegata TaxID=151549 RepID=A0A4C1V7H2_EUMVA|nr:hypothetical protein EVAR_30806_1 [Eumeta japonica]
MICLTKANESDRIALAGITRRARRRVAEGALDGRERESLVLFFFQRVCYRAVFTILESMQLQQCSGSVATFLSFFGLHNFEPSQKKKKKAND